MVSAADFAIQTIQVVAFASGEMLRPSLVLLQGLQHYSAIYDAEPVSLPLPEVAPEEIPSVILFSRDGSLRMDVARRVVRLSWNRVNVATQPVLEQVCSEFADRAATLFETTERTVGRLGVVVTRRALLDNPGQALAQRFCRDRWLQGPLNRPEGFELHAHKVFELSQGLPVNSWVRIKAHREADQVYRYVIVEQDINTLDEDMDHRRFDSSQLRAIATNAAREQDVVLDLYFPPEDPAEGA
jgi:hypothetical protein